MRGVEWSETEYARNGDLHIAYQVLGDGHNDLDLLILPYGMNVSIDARDDQPQWRRFEQRFGTFARAIRFDPRGLGLSDPCTADAPVSAETWAQDALAVLDAVGSEHAALFAVSAGAMVAFVLGAMHPQRTTALVLVNGFARLTSAPDYPCGVPAAVVDEFFADVVSDSRTDDSVDDVALLAPSLAHDPDFRAWWTRSGRRAASPAAASAMHSALYRSDLRSLLPSITAPTLVLHRRDNEMVNLALGHFVADHIDGAQFVALPGADHVPFGGDVDALFGPIEEFLTGTATNPDPDRFLTTVLFSDIVSSTEQAIQAGDRSWRELLDDHDRSVHRQIRRFGGVPIKSTGDGVLATFDGPSHAVRCAIAMRQAAGQLGLAVRIGVHTGEVERRGADIGGVAVHVAARVQAAAAPGEVLVSRVVTDLLLGSGIEVVDRGEHTLKGVPGSWPLFAVDA
jgi:class 3 adenylate cyclase/pimeloyl-ACP methyl ester carboxylesterase